MLTKSYKYFILSGSKNLFRKKITNTITILIYIFFNYKFSTFYLKCCFKIVAKTFCSYGLLVQYGDGKKRRKPNYSSVDLSEVEWEDKDDTVRHL